MVSPKKFEGKCETCGDVAELRQSGATALIENQETHLLSAIGLSLVRCFSGDHVYFVLNWDSQVTDPFAPDAPLDTSPLDIELPPPPPKEEA